jgi:hypothetical protein
MNALKGRVGHNGEEERFKDKIKEERRQRIPLAKSPLLMDGGCQMTVDIHLDSIVEKETGNDPDKGGREAEGVQDLLKVIRMDSVVGLLLIQE